MTPDNPTLRRHFELESKPAAKLRRATREERRGLYSQVYDELYVAFPKMLTGLGQPGPQFRMVLDAETDAQAIYRLFDAPSPLTCLESFRIHGNLGFQAYQPKDKAQRPKMLNRRLLTLEARWANLFPRNSLVFLWHVSLGSQAQHGHSRRWNECRVAQT